MAGWQLKEGNVVRKDLSVDEMWSVMNTFFSGRKNFTSTYKFAFFKCILDNLFNVDKDYHLTFELIFARFAEIYWSLVAKNNLCQIQQNSQFTRSGVEKIILAVKDKFLLDSNVPFESLKKEIQQLLVSEISKECKKYVIGAFFEDTDAVIYSFSKKEKTLHFNECFYNFFSKYKCVLEKNNYFEWIKFLEKVNSLELSYALALKLDSSAKRENLVFYRIYMQEKLGSDTCFYCGQKLHSGIEVDHFVPWSFLKDDKIWNLVLACRKCNNSKRDILADKKFIAKLIERNSVLFEREAKELKKELFGYNPQKLDSIYNSAVFNGFKTGWNPTKKSEDDEDDNE